MDEQPVSNVPNTVTPPEEPWKIRKIILIIAAFFLLVVISEAVYLISQKPGIFPQKQEKTTSSEQIPAETNEKDLIVNKLTAVSKLIVNLDPAKSNFISRAETRLSLKGIFLQKRVEKKNQAPEHVFELKDSAGKTLTLRLSSEDVQNSTVTINTAEGFSEATLDDLTSGDTVEFELTFDLTKSEPMINALRVVVSR